MGFYKRSINIYTFFSLCEGAQDANQVNNTSTTVRIMSDSPDPSNSLASNVSQVTVVTTTHPPVLIDAASSPPLHRRGSSEVVIVANETNKTQVRFIIFRFVFLTKILF